MSDYLQAELCHSLGAYRSAHERLTALGDRMRADHTEVRGDGNALLALVDVVRDYNALLGELRHTADQGQRHPVPQALPMSDPKRFDVSSTAGPTLGPPRSEWADRRRGTDWLTLFYAAAVWALGPEASEDRVVKTFAKNLVIRREGDLGGGSRADDPTRREDEVLQTQRRQRFQDRAMRAANLLTPGVSRAGASDELRITRIATSHLDLSVKDTLGLFVLDALAEAHLSMHAVEAWRSLNVGRRAQRWQARPWLELELDRTIVLTTFAYSVARSAPWIFAEDMEEAQRIFNELERSWRKAVPTRCMWIAAQVSLLALHRRAYAKGLITRERKEAYNDYHKLQRHIRDTERRVLAAPVHVEGAIDFLAGLDAQAHGHIGELYRAEHAHQPALKHFSAGTHRINQVRDHHDMKPALINSRWQVQLEIGRAKACYELGRHKEALCWYLTAWRAFLQLLAADTGTEPTLDELNDTIKWLNRIGFEPELRKAEIHEHLRPIVEQLEGIAVDHRLAALAADILLRLGHLLFVLNLPVLSAGDSLDADAILGVLASKCMLKAEECDPFSTLIEGDRIKSALRLRKILEREGIRPEEVIKENREAEAVLFPVPRAQLRDQWPGGGDDYERVARLTEVALLRAVENHRPTDEKQRLALDLLLNMFTHTDSIDVRKWQAHRSLMRGQDAAIPPPKSDDPAQEPSSIEFICLRRYSSAFPFIPRPSAFRSLSGGYLVRLHQGGGAKGRPYCVAVDPGPDFVENLYRTGFSIADIQMIVVTHDHVDHVGSLDILLALLYERGRLQRQEAGDDAARDPSLPVPIVANKSVRKRYRYRVKMAQKEAEEQGWDGRDILTLIDLDDCSAHECWKDTGFPAGFDLKAISTATLDAKGHRDLSLRPSFGLVFTSPHGQKLAIVGDAPAPSTTDSAWNATWGDALSADVVVAHLSTVPLTEVRKMAGLPAPPTRVTKRFAGLVKDIAGGPDVTPYAEEKVADAVATFRAFAAELSKLLPAIAVEEHDELDLVAVDATQCRELIDANGPELNVAHGALTAWMARTSDRDQRIEAFYGQALELVAGMESLQSDAEQIHAILGGFKNSHQHLESRLEYAFWLGARDEEHDAKLVDPVDKGWQPPRGHAYLAGLMAWAGAYKSARGPSGSGLFVIGELSDELGSMRSQVAARINDWLGWGPRRQQDDPASSFAALTADIGLHVTVKPDIPHSPPMSHATPPQVVRVLCTTCNIDTDRVPDERFHVPDQIREVCVKGENEGIFYNCSDHDPSSQQEATFLEQLERFDVYGR